MFSISKATDPNLFVQGGQLYRAFPSVSVPWFDQQKGCNDNNLERLLPYNFGRTLKGDGQREREREREGEECLRKLMLPRRTQLYKRKKWKE